MLPNPDLRKNTDPRTGLYDKLVRKDAWAKQVSPDGAGNEPMEFSMPESVVGQGRAAKLRFTSITRQYAPYKPSL